MQNYLNPYASPSFPMPGYPGTQPFSFTPQPVQQAPTQQQQGLVKVSGIDGAKAYQMPPNAAAALFHESEDIFYVKTTDGAGFPTIRAFRFEPMEEETKDTRDCRYVTVEEFNKFKEELHAKQSVRTKKATTTVTAEPIDSED